MKKEARIARFEALPGGGVLVVVFRGGWIDGISTLPAEGGAVGVLDGSRFLQELRGISIGDGLVAAESAGLRGWARGRGLPEVEAGERNVRQARVIAEGFGRFLEGKD